MNEFLIILIVLAGAVGGYFVVGGIDRFLARSFRSEPPAYQRQRPSRVMLNGNLSDEELLHTIHSFAAQHDHISIILQEAGAGDESSLHTGGNPT